MTPLVPIMMWGWIPAVLLLFAVLPTRRAVIASFLLAWLFLPMAGYDIEFFPDYTKMSATCAGVMIASLLLDRSGAWSRLEPRLYDLPMLVWCFVPTAAAVSNGDSIYTSLTGALDHIIVYGLPYLIGRMYFTDLKSLRELALGLVLGGLVYVPLCWWEIRMSPQLHSTVYGFDASHFQFAKRQGGYRPSVFMQHGLMVGMWMASTTVVAFWLWLTGAWRKQWGAPALALVLLLAITTIFCRSSGASALMVAAIGTLAAVRFAHLRLPLLLLAVAPLAYMGVRGPELWSGQELLDATQALFGDERMKSLAFRLRYESLIVERAMERPIFGWGGFGRFNETKGGTLVPDAMWAIAIGKFGLVGLISLFLVLLLPAVVVARLPWRLWVTPAGASAVALAAVLAIYAADSLFNAMVNPIFFLGVGAVVAAAPALRAAVHAPARAKAKARRRAQAQAAQRARLPDEAPSAPTAGHVAMPHA